MNFDALLSSIIPIVTMNAEHVAMGKRCCHYLKLNKWHCLATIFIWPCIDKHLCKRLTALFIPSLLISRHGIKNLISCEPTDIVIQTRSRYRRPCGLSLIKSFLQICYLERMQTLSNDPHQLSCWRSFAH